VRDAFQVKRGGSVSWLYEATDGDPSAAQNLVSKLKPIAHAEASLPGDEVDAVATLSATHAAAGAGALAGWLVTVTDAVSAALEPGFYASDLAYDFGGVTFVTHDAIILEVLPAISVP
jgi:hypothetical protein